MRITIEARILGTGTGRYAEGLLSELEKLDTRHKFQVLMADKGKDRWQPKEKNFTAITQNIPFFTTQGQFLLNRALRATRPDLVHYTFQFVSVLYRRPFVISILDLTQLRYKNPGKGIKLLYGIKQYLLYANMRWAAKRAKHILTISEFVKQDIVKFLGVSPEKVSVTYNAATIVDSSQKKTPIKKLEGSQFILYVGTAHAHKNLDFLVDTFSQMKGEFPELKLVLAGRIDHIYEKFIERTQQKQIPNIELLGFVSDAELAWLYTHAGAYVFPSLSEGFGLPGLEAMAYGCPVVSSNATCLPEIYGEAAEYFDPTDTASCQQAIAKVLNITTLRDALIKKGKIRVKKYSWKKMAQQTLSVYEKVLSDIGTR